MMFMLLFLAWKEVSFYNNVTIFNQHPLFDNEQFVLFSCKVMGGKWVAKINKGKYRYLIVYFT
jgi:hypothetical protein